MEQKRIIVLGGGPAGVGAASRLRQKTNLAVTLLEQNDRVGGNAGSFLFEDIWVDFGSHRLHPSCNPIVLDDIRRLLGDNLLDRPRHGRINLKGRWIHFPLKPQDLLLRLPPSFAFGVAADTTKKLLAKSKPGEKVESFASVMQRGLGHTICDDFYFPYARKIWGVDPDQLSAIQARRRVSAGSLSKMLGKIINSLPGLKSPQSGHFYYPKQGFGQISKAYCQDAFENSAEILFGARVTSINKVSEGSFQVIFERNGESHSLTAMYVWSTLPLTLLARGLSPAPPFDILESSTKIDYRAMILIYLALDQEQFTEFDAHYFPNPVIPITRLSEPKNYSKVQSPSGKTVLCAELPCSPTDEYWQMSDEQLASLVSDGLAAVNLPITSRIINITSRRLRFAYPIYRQGYEEHFNRLDDWVSKVEGLLSFGRQGLFAHDNTHHALYMAYSAVDCLDENGNFDKRKWQDYRKVFDTHVVED